jgi:hypothetical protein
METSIFNSNDYYEVNREERHFGYLFASSLIYERKFRHFFFSELVNPKLGKEFLRFEERFDIYFEVAMFRGYWNNLGNPRQYTPKLHADRKNAVQSFLDCFDINLDIDKHNLFWTGEPEDSKLGYPGHWSKNIIEKSDNTSENKDCLKRIRWACNTKPDLLIISGNNGLFIELKIESNIGVNRDGFNREKTQKDIIMLTNKIIPAYKNVNFERIMLERNNSDNSISWNDINKYDFENELLKNHFANMPGNNSGNVQQ